MFSTVMIESNSTKSLVFWKTTYTSLGPPNSYLRFHRALKKKRLDFLTWQLMSTLQSSRKPSNFSSTTTTHSQKMITKYKVQMQLLWESEKLNVIKKLHSRLIRWTAAITRCNSMNLCSRMYASTFKTKLLNKIPICVYFKKNHNHQSLGLVHIGPSLVWQNSIQPKMAFWCQMETVRCRSLSFMKTIDTGSLMKLKNISPRTKMTYKRNKRENAWKMSGWRQTS